MKLFDCIHYEDYGHEYHFQLLSHYPKFALLQCCAQWDEYPATEIFPMLIISFGSRSLCGFTIRWKWFQMSCDIIHTQPRNLDHYRR
jgi:hypothetical protein